MKISMIACVGKNLGLGKNNDLIFHLPSDLKYFKKVTDGHMVVMGKNTFKSLPGVLKNRKNVVLTSANQEEFPDGVEIFHSLEDFLKTYKDYREEIFIIGGAKVYKDFLNYANTLYLTEVNQVKDADVYFPKFDKSLYEKEIIEEKCENNIEYQFVIYRRK